MRVWVLGTGSSGNALIVEAAGTRLLVDAGIGPRAAATRMRTLGADLFPRGVDGVVVTHEHGDHAAQLESLAKALALPKRGEGGARIHLHAGISAARSRNRFEVAELPVGTALAVGELTVEAMHVPHDAAQIALRIAHGGLRFGYATDLGANTPGLAAFLGACDTVLLEANYCDRMMAEGPYPASLKRRITSPTGHLSNDQTAEIAQAMTRFGAPRIVLCHLSRSNNEPDRARGVVARACPSLDVDVLDHGESRVLDVVRAQAREVAQLALF